MLRFNKLPCADVMRQRGTMDQVVWDLTDCRRIAGAGVSGEARVRAAATCVIQHPAWGVAEVAGHVQLSTWRLEHLFTEQTGESLFNFILAHRLLLAAERLVHSSTSVKVIAADLGYSCPENFTRSFRNHLGVPPRWIRAHAASLRNVIPRGVGLVDQRPGSPVHRLIGGHGPNA